MFVTDAIIAGKAIKGSGESMVKNLKGINMRKAEEGKIQDIKNALENRNFGKILLLKFWGFVKTLLKIVFRLFLYIYLPIIIIGMLNCSWGDNPNFAQEVIDNFLLVNGTLYKWGIVPVFETIKKAFWLIIRFFKDLKDVKFN